MTKKQTKKNTQTRPPVVVIMGHVDHGKTSILDYIRKTKVAEKESGGITQHIGAYQVEHQGKQITFIDTPGHEAFYAMRSRGAKVADIAVLVVAADDGVMPQTKEAVKHVKRAGIPMIVAVNKIDKQNADPARVKKQLLEAEVVVEEFKGDIPSCEVSATTGQGIDDLLDIINLVAEVEELRGNMEGNARGAVIEAELNSKRGPTATFLVKEGLLKINDIVATSSTVGRVKVMEDFSGRVVSSAGPGIPVRVVGLEKVPQVGEKFVIKDSIEEAEARVLTKQRKLKQEREVLDFGGDKKVLNIVLKADVQGTLEAVHDLLRGIQGEEVIFRVLAQSTGEIVESDIKLASNAKALIVGFRIKVDRSAERFARQMKVEIVISDIIYELVEGVRAKVSEILAAKVEDVDVGELKVLVIFRTEKSRMIVGGKVGDGELKRSAKLRVLRGGEVVGEGRIAQLKIRDKVVEKVEKGQECGVLFEGPTRIEVGDILQAHERRETKIQL